MLMPAASQPAIRETIRVQNALPQSSPGPASTRKTKQTLALRHKKNMCAVSRPIVSRIGPDRKKRSLSPTLHDESVIEKVIALVFSATILVAVRGPCTLAIPDPSISKTLPQAWIPAIQAKMSGSEKRQ